jgi:predicted metal-binding membrane protein
MPQESAPTFLETALRRDRGARGVVLVAIPVVTWTWIVVMARDMYGPMTGASAWMMTSAWHWPHVLLLLAMWSAMMTAMMLPAAAPLILLYGEAARRHAESANPARRVYALALGYLTAWLLFSIVMTALQRVLASAFVLTPMMEPAGPVAGAVLTAIAGLYQLTPLKRACLRTCRSPLGFMLQNWRGGIAGAFRLGAGHGVHCLGCCWALMLLLFAGGVMNLAVIVALTVWVLVEKAAPFGERTPVITGVALLALSGWMLLR